MRRFFDSRWSLRMTQHTIPKKQGGMRFGSPVGVSEAQSAARKRLSARLTEGLTKLPMFSHTSTNPSGSPYGDPPPLQGRLCVYSDYHEPTFLSSFYRLSGAAYNAKCIMENAKCFSFCQLNFTALFVIMLIADISHSEIFVKITLWFFERKVHLCKQTDTSVTIL